MDADFIRFEGLRWFNPITDTGSRTLRFRYANGSSGNRPLAIAVNGSTVSAGLSFAPTGAWTSWGMATLSVNLPAGTVRIRASTTGSNGANIDSLMVE